MRLRPIFAAVFAVLMVGSLVGAPVAAAPPDLNFDDEDTPNPYLQEDQLTIAQHDRAEMSSELMYFDDSGEVATLPATVNSSQDTPYTFRADQIDSDAFTQFPRDKNVSAIDATEWSTTSGASSSMTISQTNGATASGVDSVEFNASVVSGETATATFGNFSITDDPEKRVVRLVGNVDTLASGSNVDVRLVDADGDAKVATINSSATASDANVIGTGTGQGYVYQQRLGDLATDGTNGDGVFDGIEKVEIVVSDADATVTLVGLDAESKSEFELGETVNSNDETETVSERNSGGDMSLSVTSIDTMGETFDDAVVNDLRISDVRYQLSDLTNPDDYEVTFSDADQYSYERKLELNGRLEIPSAIDLSHSGLSFMDEQGFVSQRYASVQIAEGVGDQEFENISSWNDKSDLYSSEGATHELDSTVAVDKSYAYSLTLLLQPGEEDTMTADASGGGGFWGAGGSNPVSSFINWVIAGILGIGGTLGIARARAS
jgi:hypothetical protein